MKKQQEFCTHVGKCNITENHIEFSKSGVIGNCLQLHLKNNINRLRIFYSLLLVTSIYCIADNIYQKESTFTLLNTTSYIAWFIFLLVLTRKKTLSKSIHKKQIDTIELKKGYYGIRNSKIIIHYKTIKRKSKKREIIIPDLCKWSKTEAYKAFELLQKNIDKQTVSSIPVSEKNKSQKS